MGLSENREWSKGHFHSMDDYKYSINDLKDSMSKTDRYGNGLGVTTPSSQLGANLEYALKFDKYIKT